MTLQRLSLQRLRCLTEHQDGSESMAKPINKTKHFLQKSSSPLLRPAYHFRLSYTIAPMVSSPSLQFPDEEEEGRYDPTHNLATIDDVASEEHERREASDVLSGVHACVRKRTLPRLSDDGEASEIFCGVHANVCAQTEKRPRYFAKSMPT